MPVSAPSGIKITDLRGTINILVKSTDVKTGKWTELNRADICPDKKTIGNFTPANLRVFVGSSDAGQQFLKVCLDEECGKEKSCLVVSLASPDFASVLFRYSNDNFVSTEPPNAGAVAKRTAVECVYDKTLNNTEELPTANHIKLQDYSSRSCFNDSAKNFYQASFEALQKLEKGPVIGRPA